MAVRIPAVWEQFVTVSLMTSINPVLNVIFLSYLFDIETTFSNCLRHCSIHSICDKSRPFSADSHTLLRDMLL